MIETEIREHPKMKKFRNPMIETGLTGLRFLGGDSGGGSGGSNNDDPEVKGIYMWREPSGWEYNYIFKWNNMTQVAADWWTDTSWWQIDSWGLWRNSWTSIKKALPNTLTDAKKITMTWVLYVRKSTWTQDVLYWITDWSFANNSWMYFGWWNNGNAVDCWWSRLGTYTYTYTGEATFVYVCDLVNKIATVSSTWWTITPNTFTMTDTDITNIRSNTTTIEIRQNGTSTRIASIWIKVEF